MAILAVGDITTYGVNGKVIGYQVWIFFPQGSSQRTQGGHTWPVETTFPIRLNEVLPVQVSDPMISTVLIQNKECDEEGGGKPDGEADDIDQGEQPLPNQISPGDQHIVTKHGVTIDDYLTFFEKRKKEPFEIFHASQAKCTMPLSNLFLFIFQTFGRIGRCSP